jgi:hypothetical protein
MYENIRDILIVVVNASAGKGYMQSHSHYSSYPYVHDRFAHTIHSQKLWSAVKLNAPA